MRTGLCIIFKFNVGSSWKKYCTHPHPHISGISIFFFNESMKFHTFLSIVDWLHDRLHELFTLTHPAEFLLISSTKGGRGWFIVFFLEKSYTRVDPKLRKNIAKESVYCYLRNLRKHCDHFTSLRKFYLISVKTHQKSRDQHKKVSKIHEIKYPRKNMVIQKTRN